MKQQKKKQTKKTQSKKQQKKKINKKARVALFILFIIVIGAGLAFGIIEFVPSESQVITSNDFSVHFLMLGNQYAGDCTYIKAGDVDILIDAGSRTSSIPTIEAYVDKFCTDKKLEYVIATHGHEDHIAAFADTKDNKGIFSYYEVETIIDFKYIAKSDTKVYKNYVSLRDAEVENGATHYFADDLFGDNKKHDNVFEICDGIKMTILDQKYYHEPANNDNNHSVVSLFTVNENDNFLFTGDLEKEGEESLVEMNPNLPKCHLYKGGHHGSRTSSNEVLLAKIQPEYIGVCCCAGSSEYTNNTDRQFPSQEFINRVAKYTKNIYVTTVAKFEIATSSKGEEYLKTKGFEPLNGNINFKFSNGQISVNCSNNNTILKDTEWFNQIVELDGVKRAMRTWPEDGVQ